MRALLILMTLLVLPLQPSAALVERDLFVSGDGSITRDTQTGLDWLDLARTSRLGFQDILSGAGGWSDRGFRHATGGEVCGLFSSYAIAPSPCPGPESANSSETENIEAVRRLVHLLIGGQRGVIIFFPDGSLATRGHFDDGSPGSVGRASLHVGPDSAPDTTTTVVADAGERLSAGHFLVRPSSLPEPSPLPLLILMVTTWVIRRYPRDGGP